LPIALLSETELFLELTMDRIAIWSTFAAKPGQEAALEKLLDECLDLLRKEPGTSRSVLMRPNEGGWAIFNSFVDEAAFEAHLNGPVPKLLASKQDLLDGELGILRSKITAET
jgi:quinol monooxygenase YgiN